MRGRGEVSTHLERHGEQRDDDVGERQVGQIVIGHGAHALAGGDGPYDQPVAGHGDHRYGPVEHGQDDHQQGRHLVQLFVFQLQVVKVRQRVVSGGVGREVGREVDRDRGYHCGGGGGDGGGHCARRRRPGRSDIGRGQRVGGPLLVAGPAAVPSRHDVQPPPRGAPLRRRTVGRSARA